MTSTPRRSKHVPTWPRARGPRREGARYLRPVLVTAVLAFILVTLFSTRASAGVHVFLGLGLPLYPAYPAYPAYPRAAAPYPYSPPPPAVYGGYSLIAPPVVGPRAWVGGYWGWRHDRWGHPHRVWVRGHWR